jgi:hypothetical protein
MQELGWLVLGVVVAYLLEFTRPWVKHYFEKSSVPIRRRMINSRIDKYKRVKEFSENPSQLAVQSIKTMAVGMIFLTFFLAIAEASLFGLLRNLLGNSSEEAMAFRRNLYNFGSFFLGISFFKFYETATVINNVARIEWFKGEMRKEIKQLGGNPEELDEEETLGE